MIKFGNLESALIHLLRPIERLVNGVIPSILLLDEEKKNTQRADLIAEARFLLSGIIDYEDVLKKLPDLFVRRGWADWSLIVLLGEDGVYRPNTVAAIPSLKELVKPLENIEMDQKNQLRPGEILFL